MSHQNGSTPKNKWRLSDLKEGYTTGACATAAAAAATRALLTKEKIEYININLPIREMCGLKLCAVK